MDVSELARADRIRRERILRKGLQHVPLLHEQVERCRLASRSTVQDAIVHETYAQVHERNQQGASTGQPVLQTGQLLGHSKNAHTREHQANTQRLQQGKRHLEREAVQLRNTYMALKDKQSKRTALDKLDAATKELTETLALRQARARQLVRQGTSAFRSRRGTAASMAGSRRSSIAFYDDVPDENLFAEKSAVRSGLPEFELAPGLQRELAHDDPQQLLQAVQVRSFTAETAACSTALHQQRAAGPSSGKSMCSATLVTLQGADIRSTHHRRWLQADMKQDQRALQALMLRQRLLEQQLRRAEAQRQPPARHKAEYPEAMASVVQLCQQIVLGVADRVVQRACFRPTPHEVAQYVSPS